MDVTVDNCRFVQPFVSVVDMVVPKLTSTASRGARIMYVNVNPEEEDFEPIKDIVLDPQPHNINWVEVWIDDFRLVNTTLDFGETHSAYEVTADGILKLKTPLTEKCFVKIVMDGLFGYDLPNNTITVSNRQGAKTKNTVEGRALVAYFCEPVILTQPVVGFARLTDDRKSIVYVPPANFEGFDAFSYTVYTDRGQLAEPKCVFITIGEPGKKEEETPPEDGEPTDGTTPSTGV